MQKLLESTDSTERVKNEVGGREGKQKGEKGAEGRGQGGERKRREV